MSITVISEVWKRDCGTDLLLLLALADHADDDGERIYPSLEHTAWKIGVSRSTVKRRVKDLRERGVLVLRQEATRYEPPHYALDLSRLPEKQPFQRGQAGPPGSAGGALTLAEGGQNWSPRGVTALTPETSEETSEETSARTARLITDEDDSRGQAFKAWYIKELTRRRGKAPRVAHGDWNDAARRVVHGRENREIKAVVLWCLDRGWFWKEMCTLPLLANSYPDLRARWIGERERMGSRSGAAPTGPPPPPTKFDIDYQGDDE